MPVHVFLQLYLCEEGHTKHCKKEQEEDEQCSDVDELWDSQNEGLEDLLQILCRLDQLEDASYTERSNDCRD